MNNLFEEHTAAHPIMTNEFRLFKEVKCYKCTFQVISKHTL